MNSMATKRNKNITQKPVSFIAPGQLAKDRVLGKRTSSVAHGSKRIEAVGQWQNDLCYHEMAGGNPVHNLFVHYGEDKWEERNITEECSFLDVLSICSRFIDIYSFGIKITDEYGKPLKNDKDLMCLFKEQENVENISLYLAKDSTVQPLLFKLPEHNPSFGRDVTMEDDNSDSAEMWHGDARNNAEDARTEKVRKVRGANKNSKVTALKSGEKLEIQFFNNRAVGPNHKYWSRHLGKIVRTGSICPMQVLTWKHMSGDHKTHMWDAVKECFSNPDMESYRESTLEHMGNLWTAWRSSLNTKYVIPYKKNKAFVLKNVPRGVTKKDWEWLVKEKFFDEKFQKISSQNSDNRSKGGLMPHRSGSQPHRNIIYEMGGNVDTPSDIAKIFCATRQKKGKFIESREQEKYDEIVKTVQDNASLTPIEVVETCFGPQNHSHVFGFGGGVKRKHFKGSQVADMKALKAKLYEKEKENNDLRRRVESIESILAEMVNGKQPTSYEPPTCGDDTE